MRQKWDQFHDLNSATPTTTRSAQRGQRYDLWRVALKEFDSAPVLGVGADNYAFGLLPRARDESQPRRSAQSCVRAAEREGSSAALFALFLGGIAALACRGWRGLERRRPSAAAARCDRRGAARAERGRLDLADPRADGDRASLFVGAAQVAAAVSAAVARPARQPASPAAKAPARLTGASAGGRGLAVVALIAVGRCARAVLSARLHPARAPRSTIPRPSCPRRARRTRSTRGRSRRIISRRPRRDHGRPRRRYAQLRDALSLEPENLATLGVLGDFEARGHHFAAARSYYRRALGSIRSTPACSSW